MRTDFVAVILSHGRAKKVVTYNVLRKSGYTGPIIILIDNEDPTRKEYVKIYGDQVVVFNKSAVVVDKMDNFEKRNMVLYARHFCFDVVRSKGFRYFIQLDDDYGHFSYKFDPEWIYKERIIKNLDSVFGILLDFMLKTKADCVCMAQNGDFIGGGAGSFGKEIKLRRKAMNSFIFDVDKPANFVGRINEDVNLYIFGGLTGKLFFTVPVVSIAQKTTQSNTGGLTDIYLEVGTYVKSFYSVMLCPAFVTVKIMGEKHKRLHHSVKWKNCTPMIVHQKNKK